MKELQACISESHCWRNIHTAGKLCFILLALSAVSAQAQEKSLTPWEVEWVHVPGLKSSSFAATKGAKLISSSSLSWPDGRQALVTYWDVTGKLIMRCIDYFNADMTQTGGICLQPKQ
jgi:hypothetical protein